MADLQTLDANSSDIPSYEAIVNLANQLLSEFNIPLRIQDAFDINAAVFVLLYESLFSDRLPGIIRQPTSKEDEIHNCQIVIDVLSMDVIKDSLAHIRGTDIVAGDITAISNLLDIFAHLLEYVVKKIESDVDHDDTLSVSTLEADNDRRAPASPPVQRNGRAAEIIPDKTRPKKSDRAFPNRSNNNRRDLKGKTSALREDQRAPAINRNDNWKAYPEHKVISHEDYYAMTRGGIPSSQSVRPPSPIRPDQSQSLLGQKTINSDFDTDIARTDSPLGYPKTAWEDRPSSKANGGQHRNGQTLKDSESGIGTAAAAASGGGPAASATPEWSRLGPAESHDFSSSMPLPSRLTGEQRQDPMRSTVGPIPYHSQGTPERHFETRSEKYFDERNYPQGDPVRSHTGEERLRSQPVKGLSTSYDDLRQLVEKTAALTRVAIAMSPVRTRAERDLDITDVSRDRPRPTLPSDSARLAKELNAMGLSPPTRDDEFTEKAPKKVAFSQRQPEARQISRLDYDDLSTDDQSSPVIPQSKPARPKTKTDGFAKHMARNRQAELGAVYSTLRTEDRALRRKQDILRTFYEKDHEEFKEDVDYVLGRDAEKSKETEEKFLKKCREQAPKKKTAKASKGLTAQPSRKKPRISKAVGTKAKEQPSEAKAGLTSGPLKLENEEDLLPLLLDEFPFLHLSEHTWHELWRRGLNQIEALTRAYQESQRKKSREQCQLEDAAERHELLSNIMRKQLEHTKRQREIKEQKRQQIHVRNKTQEKRIQSARARRYYNEYQVRARGKQLKRRTKEEMVFRDLFKDALNIQRERIKDIQQYASDQRSRQEIKRQNEIDSLENFYQNQFEMLAEKLDKERQETEMRDTAQQQMMERMKRELRKKMESEIKVYQEQLFRDDDDAHFRQMDADRIKQQLHMSRYSAKI